MTPNSLLLVCLFIALASGILLPILQECNLTPTIDKLVQLQGHRFVVTASAEVCVVTTNISTLAESHPKVMTSLISQHPVKIATEKPVKYAIKPKYANVVLLDATGWNQFPVQLLSKQFNDNPCHFIHARFIVLVTQSCFLTNRRRVVKFLDDQGIVNYAIVPTPSSPLNAVDNITLYTENRFSTEEIFVPLGDLDNLHRLFPNKLTNLHGFPIRVGVKQNDYPYLMIWDDGKVILGVVRGMFDVICVQTLNLNSTFFHQTNDRYDGDAYYDITFKREHFQHEFAFRELGGMCLSCPDRFDRHFVSYLLTPFSFDVWIFLAGVFLVCCFLRFLFPTIFRYDLIQQTFFGVVGNEHNQAYPARVALFVLSWLSFYFSRTYYAKILALMSLGKFYDRPETVEDFVKSDYMLAVHKETLAQFVLDDFATKILSDAEFQRVRKQEGLLYHLTYCSLQRCSDAYLLASSWLTKAPSKYFFIKEIVVPNPIKIQFAKKSPIFTVMNYYLGLFYDAGLWDYQFKGHMAILEQKPETRHALVQVVFSFGDLWSVWMLLGGGWLSSTALFVIELFSKKRA